MVFTEVPPQYPPAYTSFALLAVWIGPLVAFRFLRTPPSPPRLAGERVATLDDLRAHRLQTWPAPAPHISAGTWWQSTQRWWRPRPTLHSTVYGLDAGREGRHTLLVVPTGLGKGLWTVTQLLTWSGSAIVNDLKGDTFPLTAGWRATLGSVYVLNAARPVHRFDPAAQAKTEDDLRPLAHAVCDDPADRNYWAQHAERILLVLMLAAKQAREPVFPFLARAIHSGAAKALAMVAEADSALGDRIRPESQRTFASAWETLVTRCASLLSPNALATLAGSDFAAADLLREPATLYFQIPEARLGDLRPFLRLWTSLMQQLATGSDLAGGNHHPLLLVLDEAGRTPFADLPDYLVTLRSRRVSCAVLVQALSQLRAAYGQQADTILANCSIQIYARTEDLATMEYISRRIGYAEEIVPTTSQTQSFLHGSSVTHGEHRRFRPIVTPQQLRTLQDYQIAAFLPACPPAALARMDWRQHLALTQRSALRPPDMTPLPVQVSSPASRAAMGYIEPDGAID